MFHDQSPGKNVADSVGLPCPYRVFLFFFLYKTIYLYKIMRYSNVFSSEITARASFWGWSGDVKVLCILCNRDVQLILAYSWARPAILTEGI